MKRSFFLETERIGFSCWQADDLPLARVLWGDPAVSRFICAAGRFSDEEIMARLFILRNGLDTELFGHKRASFLSSGKYYSIVPEKMQWEGK